MLSSGILSTVWTFFFFQIGFLLKSAILQKLVNLGKVIEQAIANQLQAFLEETSALDPFQSGDRRKEIPPTSPKLRSSSGCNSIPNAIQHLHAPSCPISVKFWPRMPPIRR